MCSLAVDTLDQLDGETLARRRAATINSDFSPSSQSQALAAMRSFLRWSRALGLHGLGDATIRETLRTPAAKVVKPYTVLSEPEIARLIQACADSRERALVAILVGAGLRAAEAASLDVADLKDAPLGQRLVGEPSVPARAVFRVRLELWCLSRRSLRGTRCQKRPFEAAPFLSRK